MGLKLRHAMLINGILYNSEAWQSISEDEYKQLEEVDNSFLRRLLNAHSKTSTAFLHLETGTLPIRFTIANRRLVYYHTIVSKPDSELVNRVFKAQMSKPTKGDWFTTISEDFKLIEEEIENFDESTIKSMQLKKYKQFIKKKIKHAAFEYLEKDKSTKSKVKNIEYKNLAKQSYISSSNFTDDEVFLLARLRSRNIVLKENFSGMYSDTLCSLGCHENETQQHILTCKPILEKSNASEVAKSIAYCDIFGTEKRQKLAVLVYKELLRMRDELLNC